MNKMNLDSGYAAALALKTSLQSLTVVTAIECLLVKKGIITESEFNEMLEEVNKNETIRETMKEAEDLLEAREEEIKVRSQFAGIFG